MRAFRIAYDGRPFHGFQRQPTVPTVEDALFDACRRLDLIGEDADAPPGYSAAGRTDAGVSAVAQTVAFEAPAWCAPRALNSELPASVRAWAAADVPPEFHATHDPVRRTYEYHLFAPSAGESDAAVGGGDGNEAGGDAAVGGGDANGASGDAADTGGSPGPDSPPASIPSIDDDRVRAALDALSGERDFHNLTPDEAGTVRTLSGELDRDGDFLAIRVSAGGFARQLVRRLVALVRAVGAGTAGMETVDRVLSPEPLSGPEGIGPAPPEPLVLVGVEYPNVAFETDGAAVESARTAFSERLVAGRVRARVADRIRRGMAEGDAGDG